MPDLRRYLCRFNHFDLQTGFKYPLHCHLQEIIWYGKLRFQQALLKISQATHKNQIWMQQCLVDELVHFLLSKYYL